MFTGIVQAVGRIAALERRGADARVRIEAGGLGLGDVALGDSIAVNGVCLTAVEIAGEVFAADVSAETLARTTLGGLAGGDPVNLEKALTLSTPLGGHLVTGHVDGVGEVLARRGEGRGERLRLRAPAALARYIAAKGSIAVDGVSLTVNAVEGAEFELMIVPHTLERTIIRHYAPGRRVNLEVDIVARYLERLLLGERAAEPGAGLTLEFLREHGFAR
ncbi:riboflavin synthase [Inmirania thermothiophila]|uniref:Riboflavin synthase n=1 Tax=Inmirania thermothiophila TaxID=1750597 RepID=A0A3N1Y872_9GAMM|nr:riboflavin synthase [Inmirania thermothiophila]ROR34965.1 riboflavin synthase alpha chain [Inmirania thermothiophila]